MPGIEGLYRQYGGPLLLFAISICGESSRAQDAVHQVFLKLIETDSLNKALDPKAYLFASVRNTERLELAFIAKQIWWSSGARARSSR